ncbi:hypothetical protein FKM82_023062 [Ascaphus truei]
MSDYVLKREREIRRDTGCMPERNKRLAARQREGRKQGESAREHEKRKKRERETVLKESFGGMREPTSVRLKYLYWGLFGTY